MTQNKKFGLITFFTILLPLALSFVNYYKSNIRNFEWGYDHRNDISTAGLIVAVIGCIIILGLNSKSNIGNNIWKTAMATLLIIFVLYLFLGISSNFGF